MRGAAKIGWGLSLILTFEALAAYAGGPGNVGNKSSSEEAIARHIEILKTGKAQQRAAAAYWLGQQHSAVAAALVNIGHPSIDPLIRVLKTSPDAQARKNAAWALGALHDAGGTATQI